MIRIKFYRFIKVFLFEYRSFIKDKDWPVKPATYILIKGDYQQNLIDNFIEQGYVEEWPKARSENG